ncbi:Complement C1q-like protein 3 [Branchiostoma belcheri]|nr:Complement C1q-like protein 3 [Branchiostoma belcheri]
MSRSSDIVTLDVGGHVYRTTLATLTRYPDSMLNTIMKSLPADLCVLAVVWLAGLLQFPCARCGVLQRHRSLVKEDNTFYYNDGKGILDFKIREEANPVYLPEAEESTVEPAPTEAEPTTAAPPANATTAAQQTTTPTSGPPPPPVPPKPVGRVAFSVARLTPFGPLRRDTVLPFEHMFSNAGGGFCMHTSIFTAPVSGTYQFWWSGQKRSEWKMYLGLYKNGEEMAGVYEADIDPARFPNLNPRTASNTVVMHLYEKDEMTVVIAEGAQTYSTEFGKYTSFSGVLLFPDDPEA